MRKRISSSKIILVTAKTNLKCKTILPTSLIIVENPASTFQMNTSPLPLLYMTASFATERSNLKLQQVHSHFHEFLCMKQTLSISTLKNGIMYSHFFSTNRCNTVLLYSEKIRLCCSYTLLANPNLARSCNIFSISTSIVQRYNASLYSGITTMNDDLMVKSFNEHRQMFAWCSETLRSHYAQTTSVLEAKLESTQRNQ